VLKQKDKKSWVLRFGSSEDVRTEAKDFSWEN
jgi:hypothetical protein